LGSASKAGVVARRENIWENFMGSAPGLPYGDGSTYRRGSKSLESCMMKMVSCRTGRLRVGRSLRDV
jgi:hypothetical protein